MNTVSTCKGCSCGDFLRMARQSVMQKIRLKTTMQACPTCGALTQGVFSDPPKRRLKNPVNDAFQLLDSHVMSFAILK